MSNIEAEYSETEILDFIHKFQNPGTIKTFTEGNCYWFAFILINRFKKDSHIMYNQIDNHFAVLINHDLYDITGKIETLESVDTVGSHSIYIPLFNKKWIEWKMYYAYDELDYTRVKQYCINLKNE